MRRVLLVLLFLSSVALAWDPYPYPLPFEQVIQSSSCAYMGIVEEAVITDKTKSAIKAVAQIKITDCFRGQDCKVGQIMEYTYLAQTIEETHLSASFPVGENMLIALKSACSVKHEFISSPVGSSGIDAGYVCPIFPFSIRDIGNNETICRDNIFNKKVAIVLGKIKPAAK